MNTKNKHSLLITDKDIHNLNTIFSYLEQAEDDEYNVMNASNAEMAILIARKKQPELIFLDWETAQQAEFDILKNLKSVKDTARIPVVLLLSDAYKQESPVRGYPYLNKPVSKKSLFECIQANLINNNLVTETNLNYQYQTLQKTKQTLEHQLAEVRKEKELLAINIEKLSKENQELRTQKAELLEKIAQWQAKWESHSQAPKSIYTPDISPKSSQEDYYYNYISLVEYILPKKITQHISQKTDIQVKLYENMLLLVVQFEDTGAIVANLGTDKLAQELRNFFGLLEDIRKKYALERIASMPHQYICSTLLNASSEQSTINLLLNFAREVKQAIEQMHRTNLLLKLPELPFSLSLQQGELLAGKVGKREIAYDIWGDITQALPYQPREKPYILASETFAQSLIAYNKAPTMVENNIVMTQRKGLQKVFEVR